jgi:hypothetical protein
VHVKPCRTSNRLRSSASERPRKRTSVQDSETPAPQETSIIRMVAIAETSHQWLICMFSNHRAITASYHARRIGSLKSTATKPAESKGWKVPWIKPQYNLEVIDAAHMRINWDNMFLRLLEPFGAFGIAVGACICGISGGYQS